MMPILPYNQNVEKLGRINEIYLAGLEEEIFGIFGGVSTAYVAWGSRVKGGGYLEGPFAEENREEWDFKALSTYYGTILLLPV